MGLTVSKTQNPVTSNEFLLDQVSKHKGGVNCMTLDPDGSLLVTGGEDMTAKVWKIEENPIVSVATLCGHTGYITCVAIHSLYVITGSSDNTLRKWLMSSWECVFVYIGHEDRVCRLFCAGDFIFSSSHDKTARTWDLHAKEGDSQDDVGIRVFKGHNKGVLPIAFMPAVDNPLIDKTICSGDLLFTGSADHTVKSWSFETGKCLQVFKGHKAPINAMVVDPEGILLFTGDGDGKIFAWNIESGERVHHMKDHQGAIINMLGHNKMLYSCSADSTARAWVMQTGECVKVYRGHSNTVTCLRYLDGYLFTGCGDQTARMFKVRTGECVRTFKGHSCAITQIEVVGSKLFTASNDGTFRVWNTTASENKNNTGQEDSEVTIAIKEN